MKGSLVAIDSHAGRPAAALLRDGRLEDLLVDPPEGRIRPGAVYRARAGRPMKGQGGLFLETPDGPVYLRAGKGIAPGAALLVQTTTYAEAGKAPPVTQRLVFKSRFALVTPGAPGLNVSRSIRDEARRAALTDLAATEIGSGEELGVILRSSSAEADDGAVREDVATMLDLARRIMQDASGPPEKLLDGPGAEEIAFRDWPAPDAVDTKPGAFSRHGIDAMLDGVAAPEHPLPGGGRITVEATRALIAVDVDTGGDTSPAAGLKANIAAVRELPRLLRLKGLGGQIVVDMAPVPKRDRVRIEQQIKAAFRSDSVETSLVGWTPLGHAELLRKRERLPIEESLA